MSSQKKNKSTQSRIFKSKKSITKSNSAKVQQVKQQSSVKSQLSARKSSLSVAGEEAKKVPKLKPEGDVHSTSGRYDCCAFVIHCPVHDKVLVSRQEGALWMPFTQLPPNRSYQESALYGFCVVMAAASGTTFDTLKRNPPYQTYKLIQLLRTQMPQTYKYLTRLIYYFKLNSKSNDKCCQSSSPHLEWLPLSQIEAGKVSQLWGPELIQCCQLISQRQCPREVIVENSMEDVFLFVPRDPPRNLEEEILLSLRITVNDVERLYAVYFDHCFPCRFFSSDSFKCYMTKYGFCKKDNARLNGLFAAFNRANNGFLSFHELLLGLACMEPNALHGEFRVRFIFRYYDTDHSGSLSTDELKVLIADMCPTEQVEACLREAITAIGVTSVSDRMEITTKDFVRSVGEHKFRGTSSLCRSPRPIFTQIIRLLARKNVQHQNGCKNALGQLMNKSNTNEVCLTCQEKKYEVARHLIEFNLKSNRKINKQLAQITRIETDRALSRPTAEQYSLECVFSGCSAANKALNLIREFNDGKGTTDQPEGFMQDRMDDLWKLMLALQNDVDILLEEEFKCQNIYSPCYVIGDIHGNLEDLLSMEKALWGQLPAVSANYIFLGDYVDRGQWGFEVALYLVAFKVLCPNKVTLLRGNHEVRSLQTNYTYQQECIFKYGDSFGKKIWELSNRIFDKLPVCALVDDAIFCAHGGIPRAATQISQIVAVKRDIREPEDESAIAWEILWSDPCQMQQFLEVCELHCLNPQQQNGFVFNDKRCTAFMFNEDGAKQFLRANFLTHIIRAHEVAQPGYAFHFGNKCATIFSCSHYCGNDNQCGVILADNQRLRVIHLDTTNNAPAT